MVTAQAQQSRDIPRAAATHLPRPHRDTTHTVIRKKDAPPFGSETDEADVSSEDAPGPWLQAECLCNSPNKSTKFYQEPHDGDDCRLMTTQTR